MTGGSMKNKVLLILSDNQYHHSKDFGINDVYLRKIIKDLRRAGYPIISDTIKGYKLLNDKSDLFKLETYLEQYRKRALSILKTYNSLLKQYGVKSYQLKLKFKE